MPKKVPSWVWWTGGTTAALGLGYVGYQRLHHAPVTHSATSSGSTSTSSASTSSPPHTGSAGPGPNSAGSASTSAATSASTSSATTSASHSATSTSSATTSASSTSSASTSGRTNLATESAVAGYVPSVTSTTVTLSSGQLAVLREEQALAQHSANFRSKGVLTSSAAAAAQSAEASSLAGELRQLGVYSSGTLAAAQSAAGFNSEFVGTFSFSSPSTSTYDAAAAHSSAEAFAAAMESAHPGSQYTVVQDGSNSQFSNEPIYAVIPVQSSSVRSAATQLAAQAGANPTMAQRNAASQAGSAGVDALKVAEIAKLHKAGATAAQIASYLSNEFGDSPTVAGQEAASLAATGTLFGDPVPGYTPHVPPTADGPGPNSTGSASASASTSAASTTTGQFTPDASSQTGIVDLPVYVNGKFSHLVMVNALTGKPV